MPDRGPYLSDCACLAVGLLSDTLAVVVTALAVGLFE